MVDSYPGEYIQSHHNHNRIYQLNLPAKVKMFWIWDLTLAGGKKKEQDLNILLDFKNQEIFLYNNVHIQLYAGDNCITFYWSILYIIYSQIFIFEHAGFSYFREKSWFPMGSQKIPNEYKLFLHQNWAVRSKLVKEICSHNW